MHNLSKLCKRPKTVTTQSIKIVKMAENCHHTKVPENPVTIFGPPHYSGINICTDLCQGLINAQAFCLSHIPKKLAKIQIILLFEYYFCTPYF